MTVVLYEESAHKILVEEPEEKRPLGRSRRRWQDNMTICIQERGWMVGDWIIYFRTEKIGVLF